MKLKKNFGFGQWIGGHEKVYSFIFYDLFVLKHDLDFFAYYFR